MKRLRAGDLEEHLRLRAVPAERGVRYAGEIPDDGLLGELKLESVDERIENDLCESHFLNVVRRENGNRTYSSPAERT